MPAYVRVYVCNIFTYRTIFGVFGLLIISGLVLDFTYRLFSKKERKISKETNHLTISNKLLPNNTMIDRLHTDKTAQFFLGFSPYTNWLDFVAVPKAKKKDHITSINGIRFFSMTWVVLSHVYIQALNLVPLANMREILFGEVRHNTSSQFSLFYS